MILKTKDEILNWLKKYDKKYHENIKSIVMNSWL